MRNILALIILLCISTTSVFAQNTVTLKKFIELASVDNSFLMQVMATGEAFGWANSDLIGKSQKPLYCPPDKFSFMPKNYLSILQEQVNKKSNLLEKDFRIYPLLLLEGLKETFPCN